MTSVLVHEYFILLCEALCSTSISTVECGAFIIRQPLLTVIIYDNYRRYLVDVELLTKSVDVLITHGNPLNCNGYWTISPFIIIIKNKIICLPSRDG